MDDSHTAHPSDLEGRAGLLPVADALRLVAEGAALATGSPGVSVALVRDDQLHVVAVSGNPDLDPVPVESLLRALGEGLFTRVGDRLVAALRDEHGALLGALSVRLTDHEAGPDELRLLTAYAGQAARAAVAATAADLQSDRLRLADAVRRVVREAAERRSLPHVLETAQPALLQGLGARGMWIQTFDEEGLGRGTVHSADGRTIEFTETVYAIAYNLAHLLWERQDTLILSRRRHSRLFTPAESRDVAEFLASLDLDSILFVPVGAGLRCLGNLVLTREEGQPEWGDDEAVAALEIGRDLGVAVQSVLSHERERRLADEVQSLEGRVNRLVASTSGADSPGAFNPGGRAIERELLSTRPDLVRTRTALRSAGDLLEQAGRRRDAQARTLADALATGQPAAPGALDAYRRLREEHREAHLYWQVAYDAWEEVDAAGG